MIGSFSSKGSGGGQQKEAASTFEAASIAFCLDTDYLIFKRTPSLCAANSGAYMHWMVLMPLL
jgi:hypothetical protein